MFRKDLIPLLLDRSWTLAELARAVRVPPRDLEEDLHHLRRSLEHTPYQMEVTPGRCRRCGFEFGPEKIRRPSRCPSCRGTWVEPPRFHLEREGDSGGPDQRVG